MSGAQSENRSPIAVARPIPGVNATLSFTVSRFDGWTLVAIAGEIDSVTAPELHAVLQEFGNQSVCVDLHDATFLDSSGRRTLMRAREQIILAGGRLAIRSPWPNLQVEFERTGLTDSRADDRLST